VKNAFENAEMTVKILKMTLQKEMKIGFIGGEWGPLCNTYQMNS